MAGKAGGSGSGGGSKKGKLKKKESSGRVQYTMKIVESQTCEVCKQQCPRGIRYLEQMSQPGAVGYGVPCILTKKAVN